MKRRHLLWLGGGSAIAAGAWKMASQSSPQYRMQADASPSGKPANLQVDWQTVVARSTPFLFGSNDYEITKPEALKDERYKQILKQLDTRLIRIHHADLSDRWSNARTQTWDEGKLNTAFDAFYPHNPTLVQNIPRWTAWMRQDQRGLLDPRDYDRYANFCAELVRILNVKQKRRIQFWEPMNERDEPYKTAGKLDQLWDIYNRATTAMKAVDPKIKVGGPVLTYDAEDRLESFLRACKSNVDFISWHRYASGDAKESTDAIMKRTPEYGEQVQRLRDVVSRMSPDRTIPLFLGEYNMNYTWDSGEERQNTHVGAVWFASVLKHLGEAKIDMAASWHLKDGIYGMIDPDNNLRPAATVFQWGRQHLVGDIVKTQSNQRFLEGFAVQKPDGGRSLLLINKSAQAFSVKLMMNLPDQTALKSAQLLSARGRQEQPLNLINPSQLNLPDYSLLLLQF